MIVFDLSNTRTFKCIPSSYNGGIIVLNFRDETKNITYAIEYDSVYYQNFQLMIPFTGFTMTEGQSFEIEVLEDGNLIYRGKAYVTAQTDLENYEMNKGILKV
jgi:hypothetical protein